MKNRLFNKRIPTILGLGIVVLGIVLTTGIVKMQTNLRSNASISEVPQNVKVTNLSDNSFTITYQTNTATTGFVNYGKSEELGNTQLDNLDKEKSNLSSNNLHSITIEKLSPDTKYYLVIISGQNTFLNNGIPFEISTGPSIPSPAGEIAIKGKLILPDGSVPNEALIYLSTDNSQLLSTTAGKEGRFKFALKGLRTDGLSSYLEINDNTVLKLLAISGSLKSTVLVSLKEANAIPTITLSNDYDFTNELIPVASKSAKSESAGFPNTIVQSSTTKPQILTPKKDQSFTDPKPQFRGTSLPNETVEITIHSDENIQTQVKADINGNWTYRPPNILSEGSHTITIKTRNSEGILTTLMQSFTVFASGSQVSESATPSATPTQKITPTLTPTPTSFPSPTIIILNPTFTPTPTPLPTSVPIATKGNLPPTGNSPTILIIGGIITAISGIVLFLLTRTVL